MNLVGKALWYIESHLADEIALPAIAEACAVSRFHLARVFGLATGHSVMRYVRGRRLSEAARVLARGDTDILRVALDWGYGSHEAFTRAFRDRFGVTPETVRAGGNLNALSLMEPLTMTSSTIAALSEPRREAAGPLLIAGLKARHAFESLAGIPLQWQTFVPWIGAIPGQLGDETFGICCDAGVAGHLDYVCGVRVSSLDSLPGGLTGLRLPARTYLVFRHPGHVSDVHLTWQAIMNEWLPASGSAMADAPGFERYGADFDPRTGLGGIEIWVPVVT